MRHPTRVDPGRHDNSLSIRIDLAPSGSGIASAKTEKDTRVPDRADSVDARSPPIPLFDVAACTAALERLFELMWEHHCSGGHVRS
jgi:hypothetical protein